MGIPWGKIAFDVTCRVSYKLYGLLRGTIAPVHRLGGANRTSFPIHIYQQFALVGNTPRDTYRTGWQAIGISGGDITLTPFAQHWR